MPTLPQLKLPAAILVVAALFVVPAAANATLAYTKGLQKPKVYVAEDNGKGARSIGAGRTPHVSPDGEDVVYERETKGGTEMRLWTAESGKSERLLNPWQESYVFAWSPDSTMVAALTGSLNGPDTLVAINVETLKRTKLATGYFNGISFSPESEELVYAVAPTQDYPPKSTIYRIGVDGTGRVALSHDKKSMYPLWGPTGQIVFARQMPGKSRPFGPANQLFVMNENGERISQVTHTKVDAFAQGLTPLSFSEDGKRLLTEFGGQDQSYAVSVNLVTGAEKNLSPKNPETGLMGAALSADGKTVLGTVGLGFGPGLKPKVVTVPFGGGKEKVLVIGGYSPSWGN
jgi:Tol biopolymer transport system component